MIRAYFNCAQCGKEFFMDASSEKEKQALQARINKECLCPECTYSVCCEE